MEILKVSSKSNPNNVAGAITNILKESNEVDIHVIGAGALNQLIKSIIISRGFLAPLGIDVICVPSFVDININQSLKTGINISIRKSKI